MNILFVCLGNICRSPAAEAVFKSLAEKEITTHSFNIDSAGTSAYHAGERADSRMRKMAIKRFYNLTSRSRQFIYSDFKKFDYIIVMDNKNYKDVLSIDKENKYINKVKLITDFSKNYFNSDVPDPYYGGNEGFNEVLNILEESCQGLLEYLKSAYNLK